LAAGALNGCLTNYCDGVQALKVISGDDATAESALCDDGSAAADSDSDLPEVDPFKAEAAVAPVDPTDDLYASTAAAMLGDDVGTEAEAGDVASFSLLLDHVSVQLYLVHELDQCQTAAATAASAAEGVASASMQLSSASATAALNAAAVARSDAASPEVAAATADTTASVAAAMADAAAPTPVEAALAAESAAIHADAASSAASMAAVWPFTETVARVSRSANAMAAVAQALADAMHGV
jgi:trimeric autotransporter adhesin